MYKSLTINGTIYAHYDTQDDTLFLKNLFPEKFNDDFIIYIIQTVENKRFKYASYLNV